VFPWSSHKVPEAFPEFTKEFLKHSHRVPQNVPTKFPVMKRKQGQRRHSYLITFLVALKQRFWARREASPQCKKQHLRRCLDLIILVVDTSSSSLFEPRMLLSLEFRLCSLRHFAMAFFRLPHLHMKQTKGLASLKPQCELRRELPYRPGLSRGRFRTDGRTDGRSDDGRGGVRDLDAL
jgi:hypothetical protein